jgi:PKD repeat protein
MLYVKDKEITANANDNNFVAEGTTILSLQMESISIPKASLSGLPAGMKYTDKALTVKATKTEEAYDVPANAIYGTPTKPGLYTVTVKLTNATIKKAIEKKFTIEVPNLIAANDYFVDNLDNGIGKKRVLSVGITNIDEFLPSLKLNSATAKLAVSGLPSGLKYDAKTGKITGIATKAGTYTVTLTVTDGKVKYVSTITIEVEALPDWVVGTFDGDSLGKDAVTGSDYLGVSSLSVSSVGKITGKISFANAKTIPFALNGFNAIENDTYIARGVVKAGDIEYAAEIRVGRSEYSSSGDVVYKGCAEILMEANSNTDEGIPSIVECNLEQNIWASKNHVLPIIDAKSMFYVAPDTDSEKTFSIKFGNKGVATVCYWSDLSLSKMTRSGSVPVILVEYDLLTSVWHGKLVLNSIANVGIDNESPVLVDVHFDEKGNVSFSWPEVSPMPLSWFAGTYTGLIYEDGILGSYSGFITAKIDAKGTISAVMDWDSGVRRNIKCTCAKIVNRNECKLTGKVNFYGYSFDVSIVINIDGRASMRAEASIDTIWGNDLWKQ